MFCCPVQLPLPQTRRRLTSSFDPVRTAAGGFRHLSVNKCFVEMTDAVSSSWGDSLVYVTPQQQKTPTLDESTFIYLQFVCMILLFHRYLQVLDEV